MFTKWFLNEHMISFNCFKGWKLFLSIFYVSGVGKVVSKNEMNHKILIVIIITGEENGHMASVLYFRHQYFCIVTFILFIAEILFLYERLFLSENKGTRNTVNMLDMKM